jgi:uncharacterized protein YecT (DUF1311 family)
MRKYVVALVLFPLLTFGEDSTCDASGYQQYGEECLPAKLSEAELVLNKAFNELIARAKSEDEWLRENGRIANFESRVRQSQQSWLQFIELQCSLYGDSLTSSSWAGIHAEECKLKRINDRVKELNELFAG